MRASVGWLVLTASLTLAFAAASGAERARPASTPAPSVADHDSVQDLIFLGDARPVFLRLHLTTGGKGFRAGWLDSVRKLHANLDRNHDGKVTKEEADRGSLPLLVRFATGGTTALPRIELDPNKDGVVSVEELADIVRTSLGPFRVQVGRVASERTDALFNHLDRDKDGMLTKDELGAAGSSLRKLDLDDDELIDAAELEPFSNPMATQLEDASRKGRYATVPPIIEMTPDDPSFRPVRLLLKRYDKGTGEGKASDNRLSHGEFGIDPKDFAAADADADGALDTEELRRFLERAKPDLDLWVKLSGDTPGPASIEVTGGGGAPLSQGVKVNKLPGGDTEIVLGETHLEFHVDDGERAATDAKRYYMGQFEAADTDNNKYLEKSEVKDHGPFAQWFDLMDRDGDGKLYPKEVDDFVEGQAEAARRRMMLSTSDQGRAIFALLDLNRDRRLGLREIRGTLPRITSWDLNGDGRVVADEVPHNYQLTIGRARLAGMGQSNVATSLSGMSPAAAEPAPGDGPRWFQKMDRNHDGDISRREFLGPRAVFERLDADHDGLIDPTEAAKPKK